MQLPLKRKRGRQNITYLDFAKEDMQEIGEREKEGGIDRERERESERER